MRSSARLQTHNFTEACSSPPHLRPWSASSCRWQARAVCVLVSARSSPKPESSLSEPGIMACSLAAAEGGGEAMEGGRGESGERSEVQARSTLTSTAPKARSRTREVVTLDEAPRISQRASFENTVVGNVVIDIGHHSARTDISMLVYNGSIRAYIGFLVDTVKARGGTTGRGTRRGAVIRCFTLRRKVVTAARRRRGRSRVNRTGNDAWRHARNQQRIAPPPIAPAPKSLIMSPRTGPLAADELAGGFPC